MLTNCFRFAPRDSVPGLIAKICKYLKEHPGWSEEELEEQIKQFIWTTGVESFNGRTGAVVLNEDDVNNLKIASAYFAEGDEVIDDLDLSTLYKNGIRFVFTNFNTVTSGYDLGYALELFSDDNVVYYPLAVGGGGGSNSVLSVNGKTGTVVLSLDDILGDSGAQVKLCTATEFTSSTIETWNAYYESGFRLVCVVNDEATAVDFLYVLKQDVNNHQPIMISSGSGESAVTSVNSMTGAVTISVVDVSGGDSEDIFAKMFINENEDYPIVPADDSYKLGGQLPSYYATSERVSQLSEQMADYRTAVNLLINPDFTNPVNQRNITTLAPGTTLTYFIDRWCSARTTLEVTSNGLNFAWDGVNGTDGCIQQRMSNGSRFYGKTLTTAIEFADGSKIVASGTVPTTINATGYFYNRDAKGITLAYTNLSNSDAFSVEVNINATSGVIIKNIAVYEGAFNAENVPPYVQQESELAECYRYQFVPQNEIRIPVTAATNKSLYFFIPVPQEMRANPSLSKDPEIWKLSTNIKQTGWSFTCSKRINANYVQIVATKETNDLGTDAVLSFGNVITSSNPAFILDANFY